MFYEFVLWVNADGDEYWLCHMPCGGRFLAVAGNQGAILGGLTAAAESHRCA